jgi:ABC-type proline/glycine betaine transport system ATPase subunit
VIIIVVMHELASAFLIADRMLLIDKVKIVALGAVDGQRKAPREDCVTYIFSESEDPVGRQT